MLIKTYDHKTIDLALPPDVNASSLLAIPALIDCHVHFRVPGGEYKEDWVTGSRAAIAGGVTTVLDMPNNTPSVTTRQALQEKSLLINNQLKTSGIPLNHFLYLGATADNLTEIKMSQDKICGVKVFMGASTGNLLVDKKSTQEEIWQLCGELGLVVAVHAEDEVTLQEGKAKFPNPSVSDHTAIRDRKGAAIAVTAAIELAKKYNTKTYLLHISTAEEVELIRAAKAAGVPIFAEVTPHHLFLDTSAYQKIGTLAQMNPPLRNPADNAALLAALESGTIDTVGTDHAPHTLEEKSTPYPASPSGVPGIETMLPLLLNAVAASKLSLDTIVRATSQNPRRIFNLPASNDWAIIDLNLIKTVENNALKTKCGWSPFAGLALKGWPVYTTVAGKIYDCQTAKPIC